MATHYVAHQLFSDFSGWLLIGWPTATECSLASWDVAWSLVTVGSVKDSYRLKKKTSLGQWYFTILVGLWLKALLQVAGLWATASPSSRQPPTYKAKKKIASNYMGLQNRVGRVENLRGIFFFSLFLLGEGRVVSGHEMGICNAARTLSNCNCNLS